MMADDSSFTLFRCFSRRRRHFDADTPPLRLHFIAAEIFDCFFIIFAYASITFRQLSMPPPPLIFADYAAFRLASAELTPMMIIFAEAFLELSLRQPFLNISQPPLRHARHAFADLPLRLSRRPPPPLRRYF